MIDEHVFQKALVVAGVTEVNVYYDRHDPNAPTPFKRFTEALERYTTELNDVEQEELMTAAMGLLSSRGVMDG